MRATKPIAGQKPGTSGLRKKTKVFQSENYVENFVQATFDALQGELNGKALVVGGDGRFFNLAMAQTIIKMAHANKVARVLVGRDAILSTPAVSAIVRGRGCQGAFILTASHNPGGPDNDVGIKYNTSGGGPAPESLTEAIYRCTETITRYFKSTFDDVDLSTPGERSPVDGFVVQVIDCTEDYVRLMASTFDFAKISALCARSDFSFVFDAMSGVAGPYAKAVFQDALGCRPACLLNCIPSTDFNGGHPDPNLTYAEQLVGIMGLKRDGSVNEASSGSVPDFGAACDGDADRNMILGRRFFVTPSDSLAVLASKVAQCVPYFAKHGLKAVARSMPTSCAVDVVAKDMGVPCFEVPTGWKFFVNLCDAQALGKGDWSPLLCGEESFGTGSSHIREKDGIFAILCWLSVLAHENAATASAPLVGVQAIVEAHWRKYGRNHYMRYDYEEVDSAKAKALTDRLSAFCAVPAGIPALEHGFAVAKADEFSYHDPVDGSVSSNQGWRFLLKDGSRFVFRLSGTGSSGATVRLYLERATPPGSPDLLAPPSAALKNLIEAALAFAKVREFLGRDQPTVIT